MMTRYTIYWIALVAQVAVLACFVAFGLHSALARYLTFGGFVVLAILTQWKLRCRRCGGALFTRQHILPPKKCPECGVSTQE